MVDLPSTALTVTGMSYTASRSCAVRGAPVSWATGASASSVRSISVGIKQSPDACRFSFRIRAGRVPRRTARFVSLIMKPSCQRTVTSPRDIVSESIHSTTVLPASRRAFVSCRRLAASAGCARIVRRGSLAIAGSSRRRSAAASASPCAADRVGSRAATAARRVYAVASAASAAIRAASDRDCATASASWDQRLGPQHGRILFRLLPCRHAPPPAWHARWRAAGR